MAPADQLVGQMSFLTDAAHLLASSAPEISAYMMSQRNARLLSQDVMPSEGQKQHVCGGCGHIMIPGHGDALKIEAQKALMRCRKGRGGNEPTLHNKNHSHRQQQHQQKSTVNRQSQKERQQAGPVKVYTCGMCPRHTKVELPAPEPIGRRRKRPSTTAQKQAVEATNAVADKTAHRSLATAAAAATPTANTNSKKRAKSRKAGLQALLSQTQNDAAKKTGLSLADFLSK